QNWCRSNDWSRWRAVVFLDPYGMQVEWPTIEAIATTRAIDVWILFPLGMGANRLLTRKLEDIPDVWRRSLDRIFGTNEWQNRFYETRSSTLNMFNPEATEQ